jgi:N-acyl-L-homoserine lactone synthetase
MRNVESEDTFNCHADLEFEIITIFEIYGTISVSTGYMQIILIFNVMLNRMFKKCGFRKIKRANP